MGWVVNATPRPLYPGVRDPVPIVEEAAWVPGLVWTGAENFAYTWIRSPDRPVRSESLYRLRYPGLTFATWIANLCDICYKTTILTRTSFYFQSTKIQNTSTWSQQNGPRAVREWTRLRFHFAVPYSSSLGRQSKGVTNARHGRKRKKGSLILSGEVKQWTWRHFNSRSEFSCIPH
jgi:hypothetical protein